MDDKKEKIVPFHEFRPSLKDKIASHFLVTNGNHFRLNNVSDREDGQSVMQKKKHHPNIIGCRMWGSILSFK